MLPSAPSAGYPDIEQISAELSAIYPKITGAAAAKADIWISADDKGSRTIVTLFVTKQLDKNELAAVTSWLEIRLGKSGITVLQQDLAAYRGEDSKAEEKPKEDKKSDTSAEEKTESKAE